MWSLHPCGFGEQIPVSLRSSVLWTNQTLEHSGHFGGVAGRQDVYLIDFINRVSEALKGRKVNRGCQAWTG